MSQYLRMSECRLQAKSKIMLCLSTCELSAYQESKQTTTQLDKLMLIITYNF